MYVVFATLTISNIAASSIHQWLSLVTSLVTRLSLLQIPKVATWEPVPEDQLPPVIPLTQHSTGYDMIKLCSSDRQLNSSKRKIT